ncbi:LysM peptidoglycan-binding domain-containing protein [Cytobacillus massiliigabonensis]|uniref:LysM peptidoglycan-binding domain-containing protein n=1 Tax=Cytobacillus massiliigabonensis TaxID=1871011 RepID=UPI000C83464C|nr:LysM domain-containing protein [Cytobacillus massiliigabonensis]
MYGVYMDDVQLPVAPSKLSTKIRNKNKTITLINEGEVNMLKTAGLTELSFDVLLPNVKYPFAVYPNGYQPATFFLEKFEKFKTDKQPFQFIVTRSKPNGDLLFDTNLKVTLEEYEIIEDAEEGFDITVRIELKQYRDYGTKKLVIKTNTSGSQTTKKVTTTKTRPTSKTPPKTYTVKSGDSLWAICKKVLGDGSKVDEIAKLNGIKNPNMINIGQVIKFG